MDKLEKSIIELKEKIECVTNNFYQQKNEAGYQDLIITIDNISKVLFIIENQYEPSKFQEINYKFKNVLEDIMEAMNNKDTILIADILSYDFSDMLMEL